MKTDLSKAIKKIGMKISLKNSECKREGTAVFYPMRYQQKRTSDILYSPEGRQDGNRFIMFSDRNFMKDVGYGDIVVCNNTEYAVIWIDEYSFRMGNYVKSCVKKITAEEVTD